MKKISQLLVLLCSTLSLHAATNITTPIVSGVWTSAGSPYRIYNDITISSSTSLTIEPGVEVVFMGYFKMTVDGSLFAAGTTGSAINFHVEDTTGWYNADTDDGAWKGIDINYFSNDSCSFKFCNVSDVKNGESLLVQRLRGVNVSNCNFFHTMGGRVVDVWNLSHNMTISNCRFYDNRQSISLYLSSNGNAVTVSKCEFYRNTSQMVVLLAGNGIIFSDNDLHENSVTDGTILCDWFGPAKKALVVKHNSIYSNVCADKGAITSGPGLVDIEDNVICNNKRSIEGTCSFQQGGGAMFLQGGSGGYDRSSTILNVKNNIIANNYSTDRGGGIELFNMRANIINNTFINNRSKLGGAIYVVDTATNSVNIVNNVFYGNVSENSMLSSIEGVNPGRIFFDHNYMSLPLYKEVSIYYATVIGDSNTNVVAPSPGLVGPTLTSSVTESAITANFHPTSTSPLLGKGRNSVVASGTKDRDGYARICGGLVDIGAYEWYLNAAVDNFDAGDDIISIYPNPANGTFNVVTPVVDGLITIVDLSGRVIEKKKVDNVRTSFYTQYMPAGMYMVVWESEAGKKEVRKVTVQ